MKRIFISFFFCIIASCVFSQSDNKYFDVGEDLGSGLRSAAIYINNKRKYGFIDKEGKEIIPFIYDEVWTFSSLGGPIRAKRNGFYGFIDKKGNEIIPFKYTYADVYLRDCTIVGIGKSKIFSDKSEKYGVINELGKEVVPFIYEEICSFNNSNGKPVRVKKDGLYGFMDRKGTIVVPIEYTAAAPFLSNCTYVGIGKRKGHSYSNTLYDGNCRIAEKYGAIDKMGKTVIPFIYDELIPERHNFDTRDHFYNQEWKSRQSGFSFFTYTYFKAEKNGKYGLISINGEIICEPKYDFIGGMTNNKGVMTIELNKKYGLMNYDGKEIIPPIYDFVDPDFRYGIVKAKKNGKYGCINKSGDIIIPFTMQHIYKSIGFLYAKSNGKWGIMNCKGQKLTEFKYKEISAIAGVELELGGKKCYFDPKGNIYSNKKERDDHFLPILEQLAVEGDKDIQLLVGEAYLNGYIDMRYSDTIKVDVSKENAYKWIKMAALNSKEDAYYLLSQMYRTGEGTPVNMNEAKKWYGLYLDFKNKYAMYEENRGDNMIQSDYYQTASMTHNAPTAPYENAALQNSSQVLEQKTNIKETNLNNLVIPPRANRVDNSNKPDITKTTPRRIALVIGNAQYASQRLDALNSPINDARNIGEKLEELGFKVRPLVENGSKRTMRKAIMDFIKESKNYDVALFYYSGHGIQSKPGINATNYLIPSDAKLQFSESLSGECIDLNEMVINNLSKEREGKASLVLIDACRTVLNLPSESDFGDTKGIDNELRGLNEQQSPEGVCVVYATRAGSVSYDMRQITENMGQNSLNSYFTQGLLECLDEYKDKNLPMFIQYLKDKVRAKTNGRQVPSPYNELYGDFYFDPNK